MSKIRLNKRCLIPTRTADWATDADRNAILVSDKYVYGTDGHSLYRVSTLGCEQSPDEDVRALVDLSDAKLLQKTMPEEVTLVPGESNHVVSHGLGTVKQPENTYITKVQGALDGAYPTTKPRAVITVDVDKLHTLVLALKEFKRGNPNRKQGAGAITLSIYDSDKPLRIDAYVSKDRYDDTPAQTFDALIMPLYHNDQRPKQNQGALADIPEAELNWHCAEEPEGRCFRGED